MRFCHILFILILFVSVSAHAFELISIQAVSDSKRTFITRNGKRQGIIVGVTGTFTAENVSILARAISVTGEYAQWQVMNPEALLPFEKGTIVTYYAATEYLWALAPEEERQKYIKSERPVERRSWVFRGGFSRGLSESVSDAPATASSRGGYLGEVFYEQDFYPHLAFDIGMRYEQEVVNYPNASFTTKRSLVIADILYYFDGLKEYLSGGRVYLGAGTGYGLSSTTTVSLKQSGQVGLLPTVKLGLTLPFNEEWEFLSDTAFESLQTKETQAGGRTQTTTQTNFKFGFGLRRFF